MIDQQNKDTLARIASGICLVYVWLALLYIWVVLAFQVGFFGTGMGGMLVGGGVLLFLVLNPAVPWAIVRFVLKPIIHNALERGVVNTPGCFGGIGAFFLLVVYTLWALSRDANSALLVFLVAPLVALVVAALVTHVFPKFGKIRLPSFGSNSNYRSRSRWQLPFRKRRRP